MHALTEDQKNALEKKIDDACRYRRNSAINKQIILEYTENQSLDWDFVMRLSPESLELFFRSLWYLFIVYLFDVVLVRWYTLTMKKEQKKS